MQANYADGHYRIFLSSREATKENLAMGLECRLDIDKPGQITPKQLRLKRRDSDKLFDYGSFDAFTFADYVEVILNGDMQEELLGKRAVLTKYDKGTVAVQVVSHDILRVDKLGS